MKKGKLNAKTRQHAGTLPEPSGSVRLPTRLNGAADQVLNNHFVHNTREAIIQIEMSCTATGDFVRREFHALREDSENLISDLNHFWCETKRQLAKKGNYSLANVTVRSA